MSNKQIKVTDRRMFTPDGMLREEYRHLDVASDAGTASSSAGSIVPEVVEPESVPETVVPETEPDPARSDGANADSGPPPLSENPPTMLELISLLAEPAAVYLQQSRYPDGQSTQHLELARLHIDLLGLVKQKTAGNLSPQERMALDDALLQLRGLYLETRG